jgi:hypothetical protein
VATAAGLALSGLGGRLIQFLAGTGWGLFLIAFWRRRKYPTPPRQLRVRQDGDHYQFTWTEPKKPKKLDRYNIEGFTGDLQDGKNGEDGQWLLVHEHMSTTTHAKHPAGDVDVTQWRVTATNRHGTSKPSEEVETTPAATPPESPPQKWR